MKKIVLVVIISWAVGFVSCNKDEINNTETKVGISDVTVYATVTLKGAQYMTVPLNNTFTDPGVEAKEGSTTIQYTTTGSVNTSTVGVYQITYTATNKDGFPASANRLSLIHISEPTRLLSI